MTEPSEPPSRTASPAQLDLLTADELARLRELAATPKKPWLRDYALWIAGLGFALSLATGIISAVIGYQKDIHDQQAQLAAALHSIQELTIRQAEIYEKIQGKEGTLLENTAAKMITAELKHGFANRHHLGSQPALECHNGRVCHPR